MPTIHDLKQSKFLTKGDVTPPLLLTIRSFALVNVAMEGEPKEEKYVFFFNEHEKGFVMNFTNGNTIAAFTGEESFEGWIGKKIVLYNDPNVSMGGRLVGGIRVRAPRNQPAPAAKPAPAPPAEPDSEDIPF